MPPRRNSETEGADAPATPAKVESKTVPVLLHYNYFDEHEGKIMRGSEIMLTPTAARKLIAAGKAERTDPMPGEE
jgi:hypothetical protein